MVDPQLVRLRLLAQGLVNPAAESPRDVVAGLGAMQGQDLPGVISSIALRLGSSPDQSLIERVISGFNDGAVVRGYPMRGTVFAVAAGDLAWMTELCASGPLKAQTRRRSLLGLDQTQVDLARELLEGSAAATPQGISRADLFALWDEAGMSSAGGRGYHVLSHLIAHRVACYGPWNGQDNNVVLAETWLPPDSTITDRFDGDNVAATAAMLVRYLTGHGPATLRDFSWWTKLSLVAVRKAFTLVEDDVETHRSLDDPAGEARYFRPGLMDEAALVGAGLDATYLLPGFDEIVLGYPDRLVLLPDEHHGHLVPGNNGMFQKCIIRKGSIIGTWKRGGRPGKRTFEINAFMPLSKAVAREAEEVNRRFPHATRRAETTET